MPKHKPYDFPELFRDFALMPRFTEDIEALSVLAANEEWDYKRTERRIRQDLPVEQCS